MAMARGWLGLTLFVASATAGACGAFDSASTPEVVVDGDGGALDASEADALADAPADQGNGPRLTAVWAREITMVDGGTVGANVAAAQGGDGVHALLSGTGEIGGLATMGDDAIHARVFSDGGVLPIATHGGPGNQNGTGLVVDSKGRIFLSWLVYMNAVDWRSYVQRVDVDSGIVTVDPGGDAGRDHVLALAPFADGSFFYVGTSAKRLMMGAGSGSPATFGDGVNEALALAATTLGDGVALVGRTSSTLALPSPCTSLTPATSGLATAFALKMSSPSTCQWQTSFASTGPSEASAMGARDAVVAVAGTFAGTFAPTGTVATAGLWISRLDPANGMPVWTRAFSSIGATTPKSVAVDAAGRIIVVGTLSTHIDLDGHSLDANGAQSAFVAVFDSNGQALDALRFGEGADVRAFSVDVTGTGQIYVGGIAYAGGTLGLPGAPTSGTLDRSFVARFAF